MDKLIQISSVHKRISEMPAMYKEIVSNVNFYNPLEYVENLNRIFEDTILPHFEYEEKEIFPLLLARGNTDIGTRVFMLQDEHNKIRGELSRLNELKSKLGASPDIREKEKLAALCSEITRELNEHASKEDTIIFPLLKGIDPNSK